MTREEFNNIGLPALVERINCFSAGRNSGEIFIVTSKDSWYLYDKEHSDKVAGHDPNNLRLIKQNYDIERLQMLELEEIL